MLGPFATTSCLTPIHQMSLAVLSRAAFASMSMTTTTTTTHGMGPIICVCLGLAPYLTMSDCLLSFQFHANFSTQLLEMQTTSRLDMRQRPLWNDKENATQRHLSTLAFSIATRAGSTRWGCQVSVEISVQKQPPKLVPKLAQL